MNKKGFTLIELLAVILVLGIISLIAIPSVSAVVEQSKKGSLEVSTDNLVKEVKTKCTTELLSKNDISGVYNIADGVVQGLNLEISGKLPDSGTINIDGKCNVAISAVTDKYQAFKDFDDDKVEVILFGETSPKLEKYNNSIAASSTECFLYEDNEDGVTITGFKYENSRCSKDIVVPESIEGKHVTKLADYAFSYRNPFVYASVLNMGTTLASPSSYINFSSYPEDQIFVRLLPENTVVKQTNCYDNNNNLKKTFTGVYEKNSSDTYGYCNFVFDYSNVDDDYVRKFAAKSLDLSRAKYLTKIPNGLAYGGNIKQLNIGNYITEIGSGAFTGNLIENLYLPKQVETIKPGAFSVNHISNVNLENVKYIGNYAFYSNQLENVELNDDIRIIYPRSFAYNNIKHVKLPQKCYRIGQYAFYVNSIDNLVIPSSVSVIEAYAFGSLDDNRQISSVVFNEGLEKISYGTFYNSNLVNVNFPNSLKTIGSYAFYNSYKLKTTNLDALPKLTTIGNAILYNARLTKFIIPDSVTSMGEYVCAGCPLTEIKIGSGLKILNRFLFQKAQVTELTIPDTITQIAENAFHNMDNLETVNIGSGITSIGSSAFRSCSKLNTININKSEGSVTGAPWGAPKPPTVNWLG